MSFDNEDVHEIKYFDPSYNGNVMIVLLSAQSPHPWVRPSPGGYM